MWHSVDHVFSIADLLVVEGDRVFVAVTADYQDSPSSSQFVAALSFLRGFTARLLPYDGDVVGRVVVDED